MSQKKNTTSPLKSVFKYLCGADLFFYALPVLIALLLVGTIAQKYVGLYIAHKTYFESFLTWIGPVPVPGAYTIITLIFINLSVKLWGASPWNKRQAGIIITHMGAWLLLLGGGLTAFFSTEGQMTLYPGDQKAYFASYHDRELAILKQKENGDFEPIHLIPMQDVSTLALDKINLPFNIDILETCYNCEFEKRTDNTTDPDKTYFGPAAIIDPAKKPREKVDEENISAVLYEVSGIGEDQDGIYFIFEFMAESPALETDQGVYKLRLQRHRTALPFSVELTQFIKEVHPGTNTARKYESRVIVHDGDMNWQSLVTMNEPLRYRGYSLFQSSFVADKDGREGTVLAVVKNHGRLFPYISSILMCIGILVHLWLTLPQLLKRRDE